MKIHNEGETPMAQGGRHRGRHARGGRSKETPNIYNAKGSPAMDAAEDEKEEFGRGGRKRKAGGIATGLAAPVRGDKGSRGRAVGGKAPNLAPKTAPKLADGGKTPAGLRGGGRTEEEEEEREHHARGGRTGNSPWSTGSKLTAPERAKSGNEEGIHVPDEA